jgi:C-terminal processing protease CtpA/Prc
LRDAEVTNLVLDFRYNGGSFLAIASQLAYMVAGEQTDGRTFEVNQWNDKHPNVDPVTNRVLTPTPFYNTTVGLSATSGAPLPTLNLTRVFVLTGPGACSASEAFMNSLRGIDVEVIQVGSTTCGKPYGF